MNSLHYLKAILRTLKPEEITSLEKFISYQTDKEDLIRSKSSGLLSLLLSQEDYTANDMQRTLYGKLNYPAFNKLVNRLKEKTLEVILFNANLQRGHYSERSRMVFELRKKLMQIDLLILKGLRVKILDEINLVIKKAREFEIYDVLVSILYSKQRFLSIGMGSRRSSSMLAEIKSAESILEKFNESQALFNDIISSISISANTASYNDELTKTLKLLKYNLEITRSPTIAYYYYFLQIEENQIKANYRQAEENLDKLLIIVKTNKSVYSENREGTVILNQSSNYLYTKNLNAALSCANEAKKFFSTQPVNLVVINEILIYRHFYASEISLVKPLLDEQFAYWNKIESPISRSKTLFLEASLNFLHKSYIECLDKLVKIADVDQDKEGWNIVKRIMVILCRIELNDAESTDLNLSNMDKFIKRIIKSKNVKPRYIIISRILRKLVNENFDYTKVYNSRIKYFKLLESNKDGYCWEIRSPELIIFEEWFMFRMNKEAYDNKRAMAKKFHAEQMA